MLLNKRLSNIKALVFVALFFSHSFFQGTYLNSISDTLIKAYHFSPLEISLLSAIFFSSAGVLFLLMDMLIRSYTMRKVLLLASFCSVLGSILCVISTGYAGFFVARIFFGIGYSVAFVCCMRCVSVWYPRRFSLVMGVISACVILFGLIGQAPMVYLVDNCGIHQAFITDLMLSLVVFAGILVYQRRYDRDISSEDPKSSNISGWRKCFTKPYLSLYSLYACFVNAPILFLGSAWGNVYLVESLYLTRKQAGLVLSFMFIGLMLGCPLIGWIGKSQRLRRWLMALSPTVMLLVSLIIFLKPEYSYTQLGSMLLILGFLASSQTLIYPEIMSVTVPGEFAGSVGLTTFFVIMLNGLIQFLFGIILHTLHSAMIILPVFSLLAILIASHLNSHTVKVTVVNIASQ